MGKLPRQTKRIAMIRRFRELHWTGPHAGTGDRPEYMAEDDKLPNVHQGDIGVGLLSSVLNQAGITREQWLGEPEKPKDPAAERQQPGDEQSVPEPAPVKRKSRST